MSEDLLREELRRLVEPIRPSDTAYRAVLERRGASRRRGWLAASVAASVAATVTLVVWLPGQRAGLPAVERPTVAATTDATTTAPTAPERSTTPAVPSPSGIPPAFFLPFAKGGAPQLPVVVGSELTPPGAGGQSQTRLSYPDGQQLELFQSDSGVVAFDRAVGRVFVAEATGERELVKGVLNGVAVDATRMAYAVQVVKTGVVTSDLHLVDIATGQEVQTLRGAPNAGPTVFDGDRVVLSVGDGGEFGTGYWNLTANTYSMWPNGAGTLPISVVGSVALIKVGDGECVAIVRLPSMRRSVKPCLGKENQRFVELAPDAKKYSGVGYVLDTPQRGWPVIAEVASDSVDERFRRLFQSAGLTVDAYRRSQVAWEDATHLLVVAAKQDRHFVLRCDAVAGSCEIAKDDVPTAAGADVYLISR